MKKLVLNKEIDKKKKRKKMAILTVNEDKESKTIVEKSFVYKVSQTARVDPQTQEPQIFIKKGIDTKRQIEKFRFQVNGSFYITQDRLIYQVEFSHTLNIKIIWKTKVFSPKKSAVLTK